MDNKKIVLLAAEGNSTNIIYHAINKRFSVHTVIIEKRESKKLFIKRRVKRLGIIKVGGQILFQIIIVRILNALSVKRIKSVIAENHLNIAKISGNRIIHTRSINDHSVIELLQQIKPDVIIINGTRIISKKILDAVTCPFINTHAGITPMYRGVHGGYWALVNCDEPNCGVTVHLVDEGIDTGSVLYQDSIHITKGDNFVTYPYLQTAQVLVILLKAVEDALQNKLNRIEITGGSKIWYHPTIWQYLYYRVFKNVK